MLSQKPFSIKPVTTISQDAVEGKQAQEAENSEYLLIKEDDLRKYIDQQIDEREKSKKDKASDASKDGKPDTSMAGDWNKGLEFKIKDGAFWGYIGGRYQLDNSWFSAEPAVQKNIHVPFGYGLNWFLNPNLKCQFNYSNTNRDVSATTGFPNGSGRIHGFGVRIAGDFHLCFENADKLMVSFVETRGFSACMARWLKILGACPG